jgi:hypothetical protein
MTTYRYDDSPYGAIYYAEFEMTKELPSVEAGFEFNASIGNEHEEMFDVAFAIDVPPLESMSKAAWRPPSEDPNEIRYFS